MAKYTKRLTCAVTERDIARIEEAAGRENVSNSAYIRAAIRERLARDLPVLDGREMMALETERIEALRRWREDNVHYSWSANGDEDWS